MKTLDACKAEAKALAQFAKEQGHPCAFEVVSRKKDKEGEIYTIQPFGMHALFKSHKLVHVEPIPS